MTGVPHSGVRRVNAWSYVLGLGLWATGFVLFGAQLVHHQAQLDADAAKFVRLAGSSGTIALEKAGRHALWIEVPNTKAGRAATAKSLQAASTVGSIKVVGAKGRVAVKGTPHRTYVLRTGKPAAVGTAVAVADLPKGEIMVAMPKGVDARVAVGPPSPSLPAGVWWWLAPSAVGLVSLFVIRRLRQF